MRMFLVGMGGNLLQTPASASAHYVGRTVFVHCCQQNLAEKFMKLELE
jgi:hypothetical protein